jgi:hypothetical protein
MDSTLLQWLYITADRACLIADRAEWRVTMVLESAQVCRLAAVVYVDVSRSGGKDVMELPG